MDEISEQSNYNKEIEELFNEDVDIIPEEMQTSVINEMKTPNINIPIFREKVLEYIKKITNSIECTIEQKKIILLKSEKILNKHISRARRSEITISKHANPLTHATVIIYATSKSNKKMPNITIEKMSELMGISKSVISATYKKWYENFTHRLNYSFKDAKLGRSRKILSLYFFELFNNAKIDLQRLIKHLEKIDISKITLCLSEIFVDAEKRLTQKENHLVEQLMEREIKKYKDMGENYSDTFIKYFNDLANIIKLLVISNKSHKIIGANFSVTDFVRFFMSKGINIFLTEGSLFNVIRDIFSFFRDTKYSDLFPAQIKSKKKLIREVRTDNELVTVVGSRIKLYILKHIYNGRYLDDNRGIAICPDCKNEGLTLNISSPRIRAKEFHHEDSKLEGYSADDLFELFVSDRGNPYFLVDLIKKIEDESVVLKCGCHHRIIEAIHFTNFKKIISWENIPFPYKDIFDLPAEIIHILIRVCVNSFPSPLLKPLAKGKPRVREFDLEERRKFVKAFVIYFLKKRYIIDSIYGGVCATCGEFNTKDHLPSFEFNHLYEILKLTPEEKEGYIRIRKKANKIIQDFSCSEAVIELEAQIGGYVCRNCHRVIHKKISKVNEIFDDPNIIRKILADKENTIRIYKQSLIRNTVLIKDPLKVEIKKHKALMNYLITLFEISEKTQDGVTRVELANEMGRATFNNISDIGRFFGRRKYILEKYVRIVAGKTQTSPIRYYMTDEGRRIVRLIYYFRDYYRNRTNIL